MPRTTQNKAGDGAWSVSLVFQILETLALRQKAWRVTDLAEEMGTSKARISRYLQTLRTLGYVSQDSDSQRYRIGMQLVYLGNAAAANYDYVGLSNPIIEKLRDDQGATVVFSKVEGDGIYVINKSESFSNFNIGLAIGARLGLHNSAQGKLLLAYSEPSFFDRVIHAGLQSVTPDTITDPEILKADLQEIRDRGWASAPNESVMGLNVAAVPIFDRRGQLIATLGLLGPVHRIVPTAEQVSALRQAAGELSSQISVDPHPPASPPTG